MTKCLTLFLALICVMSITAVALAGDAENLNKARAEFLKEFRRIGLNTTPGDAMFLRIMVESTKAKRGVEVGTATGYGAILMGLGFEKTGGHLTTIDIDPDMVEKATANLAKMKLLKTVTVVEGDALDVLPKLEGEFDFLFIDAAKQDYLKYFKAIEAKMKPGSMIVADNVIRSAAAMPDFLKYVQENPNYHTVIIKASELKNDGMAVIYKVK